MTAILGLLSFGPAVRYYDHILGYGGYPKESQERELYDKLRNGFAARDRPLEIYTGLLGRALDWLDGFFGDDPKEPKHNFGTRLFGLTDAANVWTAASLDRCLLYALIYPLVTVFFIWAIWGDGGTAGTALGLQAKADLPGRIILVAAVAVEIVALRMFHRSDGWKSFAWLAVAFAFAGAFAALNIWSIDRGRQDVFLSLFILVMTILSYVCVWVLAPLTPPDVWQRSGALLLFFGVLTLLNAPFDLFSLGITRGLLRLGLQRKGYSPIVYAIVDVVAALVVIFVLACVLVLGVQLYGALEILGGQEVTLDLDVLFAAIDSNPAAPENYWVYALLLTTQAPSLFNLAIGAISLTRACGPLSRLIHRSMPEGQPVVAANRVWLVPLLVARLILPAAIAFVAGAVALYAILFLLLPLIDFDIVAIAEWLVKNDFPRHLIAPDSFAP